MNHETLKAVIDWTVDAAREHVELARFNHEEPDPQPDMGLSQAFRAKFFHCPLHQHSLPCPTCAVYCRADTDMDVLMTVWSSTFTSTVKALTTFRPDGSLPTV